MITRVKFMGIPVRDPKAQLEFYTEKGRVRGADRPAARRATLDRAQDRARGVESTQPPTEQPWGTFAKFKDADDNQFC